MDFEVGDRSEATFLKLYARLLEAQRYVSDAYRVYEWLPQNRHVAGKGLEANRNEGLHSVLLDKLNRLHRRTKGYSKSVTMLRDSIALVCLRLGFV
ncbi:MAG: IS1 family transposase [Chloroflexi bacterium]|nr:IS1 family transposase [Chloroflexota bacterium]MYE39233.1 IS1 family transposase [Chloroflexota bacterium]